MSGVSGEVFRAMGGYGRTGDKTKAQRHHEAWCDGGYCENRDCPAGKAWRAKTGYKPEIDGNAKEAVPPGDVREGRPAMLAQGTAEGQQEPADRDGAVQVSVLPSGDRTAVRETGADDGQATRTTQADAKDRQAPSVAARIARVRERLARSSEKPGGEIGRDGERIPESSTVLPTLRGEDRSGVRPRDGQAVEAPASKLKRGRPRKHATVADRKRAYRERKRGGS